MGFMRHSRASMYFCVILYYPIFIYHNVGEIIYNKNFIVNYVFLTHVEATNILENVN